ncbi:MAG TPA: TolC family protein, partial [Verrucomicrobiae bacterium]
MKVFSIVPVLLLAVLQAGAQTNLTAGTQTNLPAGPARAMSLQDCIQEALQHNLDLQIQRYNPQISLYNLNANYGGYDPTFTFSGTHTYNDTG